MRGVFLILIVAVLVASHELCYNVSTSGILYTSPETTVNRYCAMDNRTCCSAAQDDAIRIAVGNLINLTSACAATFKTYSCAACSPYEAHVFNAEGATGPTLLPLLCRSFCDKYNSDCAGQLAALNCSSSTVVTTSLYCYPVILKDSSSAGFYNAYPGFAEVGLIEFRVHPLQSTRQWVATINGKIYDVYQTPNGAWSKRLVADLSSIVFQQGELGLLTFQFDNEYPAQPYVYIYYSTQQLLNLTSGNSRINLLSRFTISTPTVIGQESLAVSSECKILIFFKDGWNHNGGDILFDSTGALFLTVGDGAPQNGNGNAQTMHMLFGKVVRIRPLKGVCRSIILIDPVTIDVVRKPISLNYEVPLDNPYYSAVTYPTIRPEIWAHGFRNPWSCALEANDRLYCGDVGQQRYEEIDIVERGGDYGWEIMEGNSCFSSNTAACDAKVLQSNYKPPAYAYAHFNADLLPSESFLGYCIIYGGLYTGNNVPSLQNKLFFADYVTGSFGAIVDGISPLSGAETLKIAIPSVSRVRKDGSGETVILILDFAVPNYVLKMTPSATSYCGNYKCELGETCEKCPVDCAGLVTGPKANKWCCGDGQCLSGICSSSCIGTVRPPFCGNAVCEVTENCDNCPYDCPGRKDAGNPSISYCCYGTINDPTCVPLLNSSTICVDKVDPCGRGNKSGPGNGKYN